MRSRTRFPFLVALAILPVHAVGPNNALNDTGITRYGDASSNALTAEPAGYPGQDARFGRDPKASAGGVPKAGFDFTALDAAGLPTTPSGGATPHPCVRDNVTGLTWEVKTADNGLRDRNWQYFWYNSNNATNGGSPGTASTGMIGELAVCKTPGRCDTEKYVADVNAAGLCGYTDWRMSTIKELESVVDFGRVTVVTIDPTYFPNTVNTGYWSASALASDPDRAWFVDFYFGNAYHGPKGAPPTQVRLVRGGQ